MFPKKLRILKIDKFIIGLFFSLHTLFNSIVLFNMQNCMVTSLQNIHVSFLRTVPPYSHQADVWVELLKHFNYMKIIFIHSSDTDGRALLGRFQTTSQNLEADVEIKVLVCCVKCTKKNIYIYILLYAIRSLFQVESVIEFEPGLNSFMDQLIEMKGAQSRVCLMYAS